MVPVSCMGDLKFWTGDTMLIGILVSKINLIAYFQLSYIGRDCEHVPVHLAATHGKLIKRLDLSFNCLQ